MSDIKKLIAAGPKVIVKIKPVEEKSEGGIILTEAAVRREQDTISDGVIVGMGETAFDQMCENEVPKIGDKAFFIKFAGKEIKRDEEYYRIINDEDVYAYERCES